jgi:hypothetical protein
VLRTGALIADSHHGQALEESHFASLRVSGFYFVPINRKWEHGIWYRRPCSFL